MYSRQLASSLWERMISYWVEGVFVSVRAGALLRKWGLIILGGLFWVFIALVAHPPVLGAEPLRNIIEWPVRALFAADVFKHVLVAGLAFWAAYRIAAVYLDDIFELKNVPLAARFILQSAFATRYDLIEIKDGKVPKEYQESAIFRIGGPGMVRVYLENAALFEKIDGTPRVIGPTVHIVSQPEGAGPSRDGSSRIPADSVEILEGFERLRSVIDLRDQVVELNVEGRTRDGIRVKAENVRLVFSVFRDQQEPTLERPYPFRKNAIETLVYDNPPQNWTKTMEGLIRGELGSFIGRHTLNEFLAAINTPEVEEQHQERVTLQQEADQLAGVESNPIVETMETPEFVTRPKMADLFYDFTSGFAQQARNRGVELRWIGLGTWVTVDGIIPARHQNAWRISNENLARGSVGALERLKEESRLSELLLLIKEVPFKAFRDIEAKNENTKTMMRKLGEAYRGKFRAMLDIYERDEEEDTQEAYRLKCILVNMSRAVFRWIGKGDDGS